MIVRNDSGADFTLGQVVCFSFDGTNDGLDVTNPTALNGALVAGIAKDAIASLEYGLVQVYGMADSAIVVKGGSCSTAPMAVGDILDCHTTYKGLQHEIAGGARILNGQRIPANFVLAQSIASAGITRTATTLAKVLVRLL